MNAVQQAEHYLVPESAQNRKIRHTESSHGQQPANDHLSVPRFHDGGHRRRSSVDSAYSELSELSFVSNELRARALTRKLSNASHVSDFSSSYSHEARKRTLRQRLYNIYDQNYGALLVLISQAFGVGMNIATRMLEQPGSHGEPMHPFQILFTRQSITVLLCTTYALVTKSIPHFPLGPPDRTVRLLLLARGMTGFFGVFGIYYSLLYLPLSEATVLTFLAPILTCYLCSLVIPGETFTRQQQMAGFVSLLGVIFIAQPVSLFASSTSASPSTTHASNSTSTSHPAYFDPIDPTPSQRLLAVGVAMIGVCGATGAFTSIRAIGTRAHAFISVNYFSTWSSIVSLVALLVIPGVTFRLPDNATEWALLLFLGSCGFVMQGLLTMGLAYKSTGRGGGSGQQKVTDATVPNNALSSPETKSSTKSGGGVQDIEMQSMLDVAEVTASGSRSVSEHPTLDGTADTKTRKQSVQDDRRSRRLAPSSSSSGTKATSMVYTQMLFALAGDRLVFGVVPGFWSWLGSGLILAGAVWVASARDEPSTPSPPKSTAPEADGIATITPSVSVRSKEQAVGEETIGLLDTSVETEADSA